MTYHTYRIGFTLADGTHDETEFDITEGSETELMELFDSFILESGISVWHLNNIERIYPPTVQELADYIVNISCVETTTGNYHVSFDDLLGHFSALHEDWIRRNTENITSAIMQNKDKVIEVDYDEQGGEIYGFDLALWLDACPNCEE